jgi:hypothetical protein
MRRDAFARVRQPCAAAAPGDREFAGDRRLHDADHGFVVVDERDIDCEFAVALDEFARAVERIDEPVARPARALRPRDRGGFFRQHGQFRRQLAQGGDDDAMRGEIGLGERRAIVLALHGEVRFVDAEDRLRRALRCRLRRASVARSCVAMLMAAAGSGRRDIRAP